MKRTPLAPLAPRPVRFVLRVATCAVLAPAVLGQLPAELESLRRTVSGRIECTPEALRLPDGRTVADRQPVARALELAAPACRIVLAAGDYPQLGIGFDNRQWWNARGAGGSELAPVVVDGQGMARFVPNGASDTIGINGGVASGHVHFENLTIEAGIRAGVLFYERPPGQAHDGYHFYDCKITGLYDHALQRGPHESKWGVLGHALSDFVYAGRTGRAVVEDIQHEHAFYLQNPRGDIRIEDVDAQRLGRTFVQITARKAQGPPGRGLITIRGNRVSDIGLGPYDGHKGGSAFTFAGRLNHCTIQVTGNRYRAGFDPYLAKLKPPGQNYGTGALVAWDGGEGEPNGALLLEDNDFEFAPGTGDRDVVSIGACTKVVVGSGNRFVSGGSAPALALDPLRPGGSLKSLPNGSVVLERGSTFEGGVTERGRELDAAELEARYARDEPEALR